MASKIISAFNHAGGTAKTTVVHNLGYHLAERGYRVLLVDLDPQGSLTIFCRLDPTKLERTLRKSLLQGEPPLIEEVDKFDLIPTNLIFAECEQELVVAIKREERLKDVLAPLNRKYDFILIDCPASLGLLTMNALATSTHLLIPIQTQFKSFIGVNSLLKTVGMVRDKLNKNLRIAGVVPTIHENTSHNRAALEAIHKQLGAVAPIFEPIPKATIFASASERGVPLALLTRAKKYQHLLDLFDQLADVMEEL